MNHSISTPENGNTNPTTSTTQDIDFSALMNFKPEMSVDQLEIASEIFNDYAVSVRLAMVVLTKTPQQLLDGFKDDPKDLDALLEGIESANNYMPSLSEIVSRAYYRLLVVSGYILKVEGGAA